jgi:hypothetical protein
VARRCAKRILGRLRPLIPSALEACVVATLYAISHIALLASLREHIDAHLLRGLLLPYVLLAAAAGSGATALFLLAIATAGAGKPRSRGTQPPGSPQP